MVLRYAIVGTPKLTQTATGTLANLAGAEDEILEAMSDPYLFNGWAASNGVFSQNEVADECQSQSGGEFAWLTADAPYAALGINTASATCQLNIPEAHAPMAATFEYGGMGTQALVLVYVDGKAVVVVE